MWPHCLRFLFNTYRSYAALFLQGLSDYLLSKEGVTQGDPLSMMLYAVGYSSTYSFTDELKEMDSKLAC